MDAQQKTIAENCLNGSYNATIDFPIIIQTLIAAGFEGYTVDYRKGTTVYYLTGGGSVEFVNPETAGAVATEFRAESVKENIRKAQTKTVGYTYRGFCEAVKAAGCAGYIVSFSGKRVVYFGRSAETHVEVIPLCLLSPS